MSYNKKFSKYCRYVNKQVTLEAIIDMWKTSQGPNEWWVSYHCEQPHCSKMTECICGHIDKYPVDTMSLADIYKRLQNHA